MGIIITSLGLEQGRLGVGFLFNYMLNPGVFGFNNIPNPVGVRFNVRGIGFNCMLNPSVFGFRITSNPIGVGFNVTLNPRGIGFNCMLNPGVCGLSGTLNPSVVGFNCRLNPRGIKHGYARTQLRVGCGLILTQL